MNLNGKCIYAHCMWYINNNNNDQKKKKQQYHKTGQIVNLIQKQKSLTHNRRERVEACIDFLLRSTKQCVIVVILRDFAKCMKNA